MTLRTLTLALLATAALSGPVRALQFYVNPTTGDDRRSHILVQDQATPWRTITHALQVAHIITEGRPHVIEVASGTYSAATGESLPFAITQTGIYLKSQGSVVVDGQRTSRLFDIRATTSDFVLRDFSLVNGLADLGGAIYCETCSLKVVESRLVSNEATVAGDAIYVERGRLRLTNNTVRSNGSLGGSRSTVEIRNTFADTTRRDVIRNNTFYQNHSPAIFTTGNRTDINSNIFHGTSGDDAPAIVDSAAGIEPAVRYNLFWATDILYLSGDRDSIKVARTVLDTITLAEQGVAVPTFVTNVPDTVAKVSSLYEYDIQVTGNKGAYNFNVLSAGDIPSGMSAIDADNGILRWTPTVAQVGQHAIRLEIITPQGQQGFLSYTVTVFTAETFPDTTTPAPIITRSTTPDTTGATDSLNTVVPVFSKAASAGGNRYADPLFLNVATNGFELLTQKIVSRQKSATDTTTVLDTLLSVARDRGDPIAIHNDATTYGGQVRNDMGRFGGPTTSGPPNVGTHTEVKVTNVPDSLAVEGQPWVYNPTLDPTGTVLIYDLIQGPATMGSAFGSGKPRPPTWTPALADTGTYLVGVKTFLNNGTARHYFPLRVRAANAMPRIVSTAPTTATEDAQFSYAISAVDDDGDTLAYSLQSGPEGMTVDASGVVRWIPRQADVGSAAAVVRVTDARGAVNTHSLTLQVANANDRPALRSLPDTTATEDLLFRRTLAATDEDPADSLFTFSLTAAPTGAALDTVGVVSWTPTQANVGAHLFKVRVSDAAGAIDTTTFSVTVVEVDDAPTVTGVADTVGLEDQAYAYAVAIADEEGQKLTYSLATGPEGMSVDTTGVVRWIPAAADVGSHAVEVRAADPGGQSASQAYTLQIVAVNDPPVIVSRTPADTLVLIDPGQGIQLAVTAADEEGDPLTYRWFVDDAFTASGTSFLHVPDSTSADTVTVRVTDGADTVRTEWIVDARAIAKIAVATDTVDFGSVALGDTAAVELAVSNPGRTTLMISNLQVPDLAFAAGFGSATVLRRESTTLELRFAPAGRGAAATTIQFATNDPDRTTVAIPVAGTGVVPTVVGLDFDAAALDQGLRIRSARAGTTVDVDVEAEAAQDLVRYALEVTFDPAVLAYSAFDAAGSGANLLGAGAAVQVTQPAAGRVRVDATAADTTGGATGAGALGRFTFAVAADAEPGTQTPLDLDRVELRSRGIALTDLLTGAEVGLVEVASAVPGDRDGNGAVDFDDFFAFADVFGLADPFFDFDGDGLVDFDDFFTFADYFGGSARPVPEAVDGLPGLSLRADEPPAAADRLEAQVLWRGAIPLRGAGLWVEYDPRLLAFESFAAAGDDPQATLTWSEAVRPGLAEVVFARTGTAAAFDGELGTLRFRRTGSEGTRLFVAAAIGRLEGGDVVAMPLSPAAPVAVDALPLTAVLYPAHPNPFNPETAIPLFVPAAQRVEVRVYDLLGRPVCTLASHSLEAGHHRLVWRARDDDGRAVAGGVYLVQMRAHDWVAVRKVLLLK